MNIWELLAESNIRRVGDYLKIETPSADDMLLDNKNKLEFGLFLLDLANEVLVDVEVIKE